MLWSYTLSGLARRGIACLALVPASHFRSAVRRISSPHLAGKLTSCIMASCAVCITVVRDGQRHNRYTRSLVVSESVLC